MMSIRGTFAVLDFEGTSATPEARATEIGIVTLNENLEVVNEFESLINPPIEPLRASLGVARISRKELSGAPTFREIWPLIHPFLSGQTLIAHNKSYEMNVFSNEFNDLGITCNLNIQCTMAISRRILGHRISAANLEYLCSYFEIQRQSPHEAIGDARDTAELLRELSRRDDKLLAEISQTSFKAIIPKPNWKSGKVATRTRIQIPKLNQLILNDIKDRVKISGFKLVVITGKPDMEMEDFNELLTRHGLHNRETPVTKKTAFLLRCNQKPGSSKIRQATELGVPVVEETNLKQILDSLGSV